MSPTQTGKEQTRDPLREAFQGLADSTSPRPDADPIESELVWLAVAGELPAAQRRELIERVATDPDAAESWRLAQELHGASQARGAAHTTEEGPSSEPLPWHRWLAAAAALVVIAFLGQVVLRQLSPPEEEAVYRNAGELAIRTELADRATVPRIAARLDWALEGITPGVDTPEVRYTLRVLLPDLTPLVTARDLTTPEYQVPELLLSEVPAGQELLWQVDAHLPDGAVISSPTFVVQIQ